MSEEEKSPTAQESLLEEIPPTLEKHDDLTPVTEIENTYVSRAREVVPQSSDFVNVIRNTVGEGLAELLVSSENPEKFDELVGREFPSLAMLKSLPGDKQNEYNRTKKAMLICCRFCMDDFDQLGGENAEDLRDTMVGFKAVGLKGIMELGGGQALAQNPEAIEQIIGTGFKRMMTILSVHDIAKPQEVLDHIVKQGYSGDHDIGLQQLINKNFEALDGLTSEDDIENLRQVVTEDEEVRNFLLAEKNTAPNTEMNLGVFLNGGEPCFQLFKEMMATKDPVAMAEWLFDFGGGDGGPNPHGPMCLSKKLPFVLKNFLKVMDQLESDRAAGLSDEQCYERIMYSNHLFEKAGIEVESMRGTRFGRALSRLLRIDKFNQPAYTPAEAQQRLNRWTLLFTSLSSNESVLLQSYLDDYSGWDLRYTSHELLGKMRDNDTHQKGENENDRAKFLRERGLVEAVMGRVILRVCNAAEQEYAVKMPQNTPALKSIYFPDKEPGIIEFLDFDKIGNLEEMINDVPMTLNMSDEGIINVRWGDDESKKKA